MADIGKGTDKAVDKATAPAASAPLELHPQTAAGKQVAAKELAASDEKVIKANVLPPMPHFPAAESVAGGTTTQNLDKTTGKVLSETTTLPNSLGSSDGSADLKKTLKYDVNGAVKSTETSWTDAHKRKHDVLEAGGTTTNTIIDGNKTDTLVTHADRSWEQSHKETDAKTGASTEHVVDSRGGTDDIVTSKGFREEVRKDDQGRVRFQNKVVAETEDGKFDFHSTAKYDAKGKVESSDVHWKDKDGVAHQTDSFDYGDKAHTTERNQTDGDTSQRTMSQKGKPDENVTIKADGTVIDSKGNVRKPDAQDKPIKQTW